MKAATTALRTLIQNGHVVKAIPKLRAEWEHNRFSPISSIAVTPAQPEDPEWNNIYDLDSIGLPNRPKAGAAKARLSANNKLVASSTYRVTPTASRFYVSDEDDPYKYWVSSQTTGTSAGGDGGYAFTTPIQVTLMHTAQVTANKVVVGFETSYSKPKTFSVQVTTDGTTWSTVGSTPVIDAGGQVTLWADAFGNWGTTPQYASALVLKGVRLIVYSMVDASSRLDVIQLGLRLEHDLSAYLESYSTDWEISDRSLIAPLGKASSNTAEISLNNMDRTFNNENTDSVYYGLIGKKVKMTMDLSFDVTPSGSSDERIREFTMWVDDWGGEEETSSGITLKDSSIFLQESHVPPVFWESLTIGSVVWQMMDVLGLSNYTYLSSVLDTGQITPYYWPNSEDTAWEQMAEIAEATQTAIYFDEYDVMQIKTRNSLFDPNRSVNWNLDAVTNGLKLADIVTVEEDEEAVANKVDINYKPAKYSDFNNGLPKMETVWEPEESTVTLRATPLIKDLTSSQMEMFIGFDAAAYWPYEAAVNIRGEILRYKGKEYVWRKPGGGLGYEIAYSQEDKERIDAKSDPNSVRLNSWSGKLMLTERGVNGSGTTTHKIKPAGYTGYIQNHGNTAFYQWNGPMAVANGAMTLSPPNSSFGVKDYRIVKHEATIPINKTNYGTRIRFPSNQPNAAGWCVGGLWFAGGNDNRGFFLELSPTDVIDGSIERRRRQELSMLRALSSGGIARATEQVQHNIVKDVWYDLEVRHVRLGNGASQITAYLNGVSAQSWTLNGLGITPADGKFGVYTRGQSRVDFEHIYGVYQPETETAAPDSSTYLDLFSGSFTSGYIEREWRFGTYMYTGRGPVRTGGHWFNALSSRANYALDEFGPVVHEIREFDVLFDDSYVPVAHSNLYLSNTAQVVCTDYTPSPFGAKFTLINTARVNAIVNGEDSLTFGSENVVNQKMTIYGRALYQEDELTVTKKDDQSIRRNGEVALTFDSRLIQTTAAAEDIGAWVIKQWANGSDELRVEVFGNPLIQLGDLVTINYPIKDMLPSTHKYYVVAKSPEFDNGLETTVTLRRARA